MISRLLKSLRRFWRRLQGDDNPDAWYDDGHWEKSRRNFQDEKPGKEG